MKVILFYNDSCKYKCASCAGIPDMRRRLKESIPTHYDVEVIKIDTDYHYELAHSYNVRSVPTVIMEQGPVGSGMLTQRRSGSMEVKPILMRIYSHMKLKNA